MARVTVAAATIGALLWRAPSVMAGSDTTAPIPTVPPTTATGVAGGGEEGGSLLSNSQAFDAAIWALAFGLIAIVAVLVFLWWDRRRSFRILSSTLHRGIRTEYEGERSLAHSQAGESDVGTLDSVDNREIVGLPTLGVGTEATYHVPGGGPDLTWTVSGDVNLKNNTGPQIRLTPTGFGMIVLTATSPTEPDLQTTIAVEPSSSEPVGQIPFLGIGYGSVVIALAVASVTAALGLTDVLQGQAVAGVLSSLVTYTVARGVSNRTDNTGDVA